MWLHGRYAIWRACSPYEGLWTAYDICGHEYRLMKNALLTEISRRPIWSREFDRLEVHAKDKTPAGARSHDGYILIDRSSPRHARRVVEYAGAERSVQDLEISANGNMIYVNPIVPRYNRHILRRSGSLGLS